MYKDGTLYITSTATCKKGETLLSWNIMGPQGPQGEQGPQGLQGEQGPAGVVERPGFSLTTLDSEGNVDGFTSITIGADGLPVISYLDETNFDLKVAHCSNAFCIPYFRRR